MRHQEDDGETAARLYDGGIRQKLEPASRGKFVVIDLRTGKYALADALTAASDELRKRLPDARQ